MALSGVELSMELYARYDEKSAWLESAVRQISRITENESQNQLSPHLQQNHCTYGMICRGAVSHALSVSVHKCESLGSFLQWKPFSSHIIHCFVDKHNQSKRTDADKLAEVHVSEEPAQLRKQKELNNCTFDKDTAPPPTLEASRLPNLIATA